MKIATTPSAGMMQAGLQASASKLKLDSLFLQWFSMPDTQRLVRPMKCGANTFELAGSATRVPRSAGAGAAG